MVTWSSHFVVGPRNCKWATFNYVIACLFCSLNIFAKPHLVTFFVAYILKTFFPNTYAHYILIRFLFLWKIYMYFPQMWKRLPRNGASESCGCAHLLSHLFKMRYRIYLVYSTSFYISNIPGLHTASISISVYVFYRTLATATAHFHITDFLFGFQHETLSCDTNTSAYRSYYCFFGFQT